MDKEAIKAYLRENLKIVVRNSDLYMNRTSIEIVLKLEDEEIDSDSFTI